MLLRSRKFDSIVRDAIAVLEDRLKKLPRVESSKRRRDVAVNALSPDVGIYTLGEDVGQRQSAQLLYQDILGFFGNPMFRGLQKVEPLQARQIVGFVDTVLGLLKDVQTRGFD